MYIYQNLVMNNYRDINVLSWKKIEIFNYIYLYENDLIYSDKSLIYIVIIKISLLKKKSLNFIKKNQ